MSRTGTPRVPTSARSRAQSSPATVLVASDWAPIRAFEPIIRDAPESIYGDVLPVLRRADLRIVNCECALTSASAAAWKSGAVFKGEPAHVAGLTAVPFDIACHANNHVLDYGVAGLRETLRVLARAGIHSVGAGLTEAQALAPLSVLVNGQPIHIVNISEGEDLTASTGGPGVFGWDIALAAAQSRALKKIGGVVIVIAHGGLSTSRFPRRTWLPPSGHSSRPARTASSATIRTCLRASSGGAAGRSSTASAISCSISRQRSTTGRQGSA